MRNRKRIEWESKTGWNHKVAFQNETTEIEVCRKEYEKKNTMKEEREEEENKQIV